MRTSPLLVLPLLIACGGSESPAPQPETTPAEEAATPAKTGQDAPAEEAEALQPPPKAEPTGTVTVTSLKNGEVEDAHTMQVSTGALTWGTPGDLSTLSGALTIHTDSWDSPIDLRDERVQTMFFDAAEHPTASFEVSAIEGLSTLAVGQSGEGTVSGTLQVLSGSVALSAPIKVAHTEAGWAVELASPVEVKASDLGLTDGLNAVAGACGVELADATKVAAAFTIPQG